MNIYHFNEHLSLQSKEIATMKKYHFDKILITLMKIYHFDENTSIWYKFITLMKIHHFDENSSIWWKFINLMKIHQLYVISSFGWKFINMMKSNYYDNPPFWWKSITLIKTADMMTFHYFDEHSLLALKWKLIELITLNRKWQLWWKFITFMKIHWG